MTSSPKPPTPEECGRFMADLMAARKRQGLYSGDYDLPVADFRKLYKMPERGNSESLTKGFKMAKRKAAAAADPEKKGKGRKGKKEPAKNPKEPVMPFGDTLPSYTQLGSPADGNWKPTGKQIQDVSGLEAQEKFLYRMMTKAKAQRDLAKAQAKLSIADADETSVSDGDDIDEKVKLHKAADNATSRANKAEKDYKRARDGWNAVKQTLHRYLTEPEKPLFDQKKKAAK